MRVFRFIPKRHLVSSAGRLKPELQTGRRLWRLGIHALACGVFVGRLLAADAQSDQFSSEAELLKDVKIPAGFDATIFAKPPMANYPVFIAAAPDGTLYVSSDGNGSLGRDPHRGRILRLRDMDGDGRADEVKEFVKDVDSPRGLVWDHDRLYLLHPPNISEYIDKDGDGIADEEHVLVKNIGWTFKDRPADHASNGLELGIDGWLYAAIGDFGFMEGEGTDGRKVQLRGGGVVRVRPDGTGLHVYAHGTRNILEAAVSPLLDVITRDNTNDGGGWDIRLHHNTGLANHGYPSLFKNFPDEIIQPLADYGGGSGCGAAWIDEPGIPAEWNNAPFTCDWGRGWVYMHRLTPKGATFGTPVPQKEFIGVTRPTDIEVDANSRIYVSSWKGATFDWVGPNVGYIVQLRPKGYESPTLPDFKTLSNADLISYLGHPSSRRRLAAQRALIHRSSVEMLTQIGFAAGIAAVPDGNLAQHLPLGGRVAAIFGLARLGATERLAVLSRDTEVQEYVIRAFGEPDHKATDREARLIVAGLKSSNSRVRLQAAIACGYQDLTNAAPELAARIVDEDPVVSHTAVEALKRMGTADVCWPIVDSSDAPKRAAALRVLQGIHRADVVDGLTDRLQNEKGPARRVGLFTALCRLYSTDAKWKGDSWGTRPDTSGPYYEAAQWEESPRILRALNDAVEKASGDELAAFATELNRHKVQSETALAKILDAANSDAKLMPAAVGQLARADKIPPAAETLLAKAAASENLDDIPRAQAILALAKVKSDEAARAGLEGLARLQESKNSETEGLRRQARSQFLRNGPLQGREALLEQLSARGGEIGLMADAALLSLPNSREAFEKAWSSPARKVQLLKAMAILERANYREQVLDATEDPNPEIAKAAKETARALRLDRPRRNSPKIETMSVADAIAAVVKTKGDVDLGKKLFTQQTCVNCHTVTQAEPQRGPYLGNIAATYKRPELAEAILVPNKSIAQGFVANHFELKNGDEHDGFVTLEAADKVVIRDTTSQEYTFATKDIVKRQKLEKSLMPEGLAAGLTIQEFASLLDYLESLNTK
jgi:putative membrane-bound dehydrogenase-like protein